MADGQTPDRRVEIDALIKRRALFGALIGLIPVPILGPVLAIANIYSMYARINALMGVRFGKNILKSVAGMILGNLAGYLVVVVVCEALEFIPGFGSAVSMVIQFVLLWLATLAQGKLYYGWMQALEALKAENGGNEQQVAADLKKIRALTPEERRKRMEALRKKFEQTSFRPKRPGTAQSAEEG